MQIMPINNFTFWNAPDADLFIQRTTNEVSIIDRVELDACHWKAKQYRKTEDDADRVRGIPCVS